MTQRAYGTVIKLTTLLHAILFGIIVASIDPYKTGFLGFLLFYVTLFFVLFGMVFAISDFICQRFFVSATNLKSIHIATRQGILIAIFLEGLLMLQAAQILTWYNFILFTLLLCAIEFLFLFRKTRYAHRS